MNWPGTEEVLRGSVSFAVAGSGSSLRHRASAEEQIY